MIVADQPFTNIAKDKKLPRIRNPLKPYPRAVNEILERGMKLLIFQGY